MDMTVKKRILFIIILAVFLAGIFTAPIVDNQIHRTPKEWTVLDSKAYAKDMLSVWKDEQWVCLEDLWTKESNWRPEAYNKIKVMGKNAGGIPQLLGLDPKTPAPRQIERGLDYIYNRYDTPCNAWAFFKKKGYH
jgi:hypothetical protein